MADGLGAERHAFVSGPDVVTASNGRRIPQCATCGKAKNSQRHRAYRPLVKRQGKAAPVLVESPPYTPPVTPSVSVPPGMVPMSALPPLEDPPEYVHAGALALALALDAVLDSEDGAGLSVTATVYATGLRSMLGVPRFRATRLAAVEVVPDRPKLATRDVDLSAVAGVPWAARPKAKDRPEVSRARAATKGIRNDKMRALATRAIASGWTPRHMGDGHLRLERAGQAPLTISTTANGAARGWHNVRSAARRRGIDVADL